MDNAVYKIFLGSPIMTGFTLACFVVIVIVMILEIKWTRDANDYIDVFVVELTGSGRHTLVPKSGGSVSIHDAQSNTVRTWPINELATVEVPYPSIGFVPDFLAKKMREVIFIEGDWEPLLNRSPHRENIASPDVAALLRAVADDPKISPTMREKIEERLQHIATGPTREMIASPAVLGNLLHEKITEAILTVNKEVFDALNQLIKRLEATVSPLVFYIMSGITIAAVITCVAFTISLRSEVQKTQANTQALMDSFGITVPIPGKPASPGIPVPVPAKPQTVPVPPPGGK